MTLELTLDMLIAVTLRVGALFVMGFIFSALLRRSSAEHRHFMWVMVLIGSLIIPVFVLNGLSILLPIMREAQRIDRTQITSGILIPPNQALSADVSSSTIDTENSPPVTRHEAQISADSISTLRQPTLDSMPLSRVSQLFGVWLMWGAGAVMVLAHAIRQVVVVRKITKRSTPLTDGKWLSLCAEIKDQLHLTRPVTLEQSHEIQSPIAYGIWRVVIILPVSSMGWTDHQWRMVLLHELHHVSRRDTLVNWLALIVCAVHWFNPLAWVASWQLTLEAEQATDERVLNGGIKKADYAELLLEIARSTAYSQTKIHGGVSMIHGSQIVKRMRAIVENNQPFRPLSVNQRGLSMLVVILFVFLLGGIRTLDVYAQTRTLSLAIPDTMIPLFRDVVVPNFQEAHPNVYVEIRTINIDIYLDLELPPSTDELEDYINAANQLVTTADVHFLPPYLLSPELTRAGYFLDMSPLVEADADLSPDDFILPIDEAFAWDGGLWALPVIATPVVMVYDPAAFDALGLNYPTENWTFADYAFAAEQLSNTYAPAMQVTPVDVPALFRIFSGQSFFDDNFPSQPDFVSPALVELVGQWTDLEREGIVTSGFTEYAPIRLARISELVDQDLNGVLLAGKASADVYSVAISSGTDDPETAYELARYLTTVPELTAQIPSAMSVRYSLQSQNEDSRWSLPETALALRQRALENAVMPADLQFGFYLQGALTSIAQGASVEVALQSAQQLAQDNLAQIASLQGNEQIVVAPVEIPTDFGGTSIKFGLFTGTQFFNRAQWEDVIEAFVASDAGIDQIELNFIAPMEGYWDEIPRNDCIFGYDYKQYDNADLLVLDPLLDADASFDPADVVGDVMLEMQRDGNTYALPVAVFPQALRYNPDLFLEANIPAPDGTWTVNEFIDALQQLTSVYDGAPLYFDLNYSTPWELLMAGFGAAPVDYSTEPPTLHLTDPDVIDAIRQVLDLAKSGLIDYQTMATFFGVGIGTLIPANAPMVSDQLNSSLIDRASMGYELTTFPLGSDNTPISFYTNSSFIFSDAPYPEACYRWLREITRHPELFEAMPAYHSMIDNPVTSAVHGETEIATFRRFADMMESPDRVFIRSYGLGIGVSLFMNRAFDRYVLEDADLEAELALAQELTLAYQDCSPGRNANLLECLLEVDPTIRDNIEARILGDQ